jgi:hypothetical protein
MLKIVFSKNEYAASTCLYLDLAQSQVKGYTHKTANEQNVYRVAVVGAADSVFVRFVKCKPSAAPAVFSTSAAPAAASAAATSTAAAATSAAAAPAAATSAPEVAVGCRPCRSAPEVSRRTTTAGRTESIQDDAYDNSTKRLHNPRQQSKPLQSRAARPLTIPSPRLFLGPIFSNGACDTVFRVEIPFRFCFCLIGLAGWRAVATWQPFAR